MSLILLLVVWAGSMLVGFALLFYSLAARSATRAGTWFSI